MSEFIRRSAYKIKENEPKFTGCLDCKFKYRCTLNKGLIFMHSGRPEICIHLNLKKI